MVLKAKSFYFILSYLESFFLFAMIVHTGFKKICISIGNKSLPIMYGSRDTGCLRIRLALQK